MKQAAATELRHYTLGELAELWSVSQSHLRTLIRRGEITPTWFGGALRISHTEAERVSMGGRTERFGVQDEDC